MDRIEHLQQFLQEEPDDPFLLFSLAREYFKADRLTESERTFLDLRARHPDYVGLYYHFGKLYEQLGRIDAATEVYQSGISIAKKLHETHARGELEGALSLIKS